MALLKHICQKLNLLALKDSLYNQFSTIACIVTKLSMLLPNFKINMSREDQNIDSVLKGRCLKASHRDPVLASRFTTWTILQCRTLKSCESSTEQFVSKRPRIQTKQYNDGAGTGRSLPPSVFVELFGLTAGGSLENNWS